LQQADRQTQLRRQRQLLSQAELQGRFHDRTRACNPKRRRLQAE
jgi:hypothetical protein